MASLPGYERFYRIIRRIPYGKVATYGQIAAIAGSTGAARQVGYALSAIPGEGDVPWHRVINAQGTVSLRSSGVRDREQRRLLEAEGIMFDDRGRINLQKYRWNPRLPRKT